MTTWMCIMVGILFCFILLLGLWCWWRLTCCPIERLTGEALDRYAWVVYGRKRYTGETDKELRDRIIATWRRG